MIFGINFNSIQESDEQTILDQLQILFHQIYSVDSNFEIKINSVTYDMIHFGFPQYNTKHEKLDEFVQVDILLTQFPEFCRFYMYSPTELESKYKGAHRNELLRAICYVESFKELLRENGELLKWEQDDLNSMRILS